LALKNHYLALDLTSLNEALISKKTCGIVENRYERFKNNPLEKLKRNTRPGDCSLIDVFNLNGENDCCFQQGRPFSDELTPNLLF